MARPSWHRFASGWTPGVGSVVSDASPAVYQLQSNPCASSAIPSPGAGSANAAHHRQIASYNGVPAVFYTITDAVGQGGANRAMAGKRAPKQAVGLHHNNAGWVSESLPGDGERRE